MARGGKREGAGRKQGSVHPRKKALQERAAMVADEGVTPLEVMLGAMRDAWASNDKAGAATFAKDAAPYIHPRLAAIEHSGEMKISHEQALAELEAAEASLNGHEQPH